MERKEIHLCFLAIATLLLGSCAHSQKQSDVQVEEFNIEANVKECNTDKTIPNGLILGEVIYYEGKNKEEMNMLSQFKSYNNALWRGDIDNAILYQYPDAAKYFMKYYPGENEDGVMRKIFEDMSMQTIEQAKRFESHGVDLSIVVSRPIRKVMQGDNILYVFEIVSNMVNENLQIHSTPDLTLAVSTNQGKNWTFNAMNDDTPNILRISYSKDIVDKVMGY